MRGMFWNDFVQTGSREDGKRFARDTMFHWKLRYALEAFHARVECPNFRFEGPPGAGHRDSDPRGLCWLCRVGEVDAQTIVKAYEKRIQTLEKEKIVLQENIVKSGQPQRV